MNLTIKSLTLEYFKGIIQKTVTFQKVTDIYIQNEGGKTTIVDAFIWLFFGKHPAGKIDTDIKTKCTSRTQSHFPDHKIGDVVNNLTHSVTAIIVLDGREIELKKTFKETWGTTAKVQDRHLKTHTIKHSFDKSKCSKTEYEEQLSKIINEQTFRMLTDPLYFSSDKPRGIHWSERRDILMKMRGEIDQTKIKGYAEIKDLIGTWGPEKKKKDLKSEIKEIKEEKDKIPVQIEEVQRLVIEIPAPGLAIEFLNEEKSTLMDKIQQVKSDSGQQELKNQMADIDTEIISKTNEFNTVKNQKIDDVIQSGTSVAQSINDIGQQIHELQAENSNKHSIINNNQNELKNSRGRFFTDAAAKESLEKENPVFETSCPTCKQDLPSSEVEASRQNYNTNKAQKLETLQNSLNQINVDGKALVEKTEQFQSEVDSNLKIIEAKQGDLNTHQQSRQILLDEVAEIRKTAVDVSDLQERKFELEREGNQEKAPDTSQYDNRLSEVEREIKTVNQRALNIQKNQEYSDRIKVLEKLEVKLSNDHLELESKLKQLENFIVASVEAQSDDINAMFELVTFQMYIKQINGGIDNDVCTTMVDGVRFPAVNSAGQSQGGVDVIKRLQKYYGIMLPIFCDNRESVTNLPDVDCQLISLFVSPSDQDMRIEYPA